MELATAFVRVRADTAPLLKDLQSTEQKVATAGKKAIKTVEETTDAARKGVLSTGQQVASTMAQWFGAAMFVNKMRGAVNAASDFNETLSKTQNIFGDMTPQITKVAETAATSMGMSKRAYMDAASNLKGLLDNMGLAADESTKWSMDLTQLGSDLASFFNTQPADAIYAISAALRGESEPIRRYNVQLSDMAMRAKAVELGLYDGKGALDAHQKAMASLALITEQTTAAQGDFARTSDGVANQERQNAAVAENSAASFGQVLLPVYQRVLTVTRALSEAFGAMPAPVQTAIVALLGIVALAGPMSNVTGAVRSITSAIGDLERSTKLTLGVLGLVLTVGGMLWSAFSDGGDTTQDLSTATDDLAASLKQSTAELNANAAAIAGLRSEVQQGVVGWNTLSDAVLGAFDQKQQGAAAEITSLLGEMGYTAQDAAKVLGVLADQMDAGSINGQRLAEALTGAEEGSISAADAADILGGSMLDAASPVNRLVKLLRDIDTSSEGGIPNVREMAQSFIEQATGASELTASLAEQAKAQAAASGQAEDAIAIYLNYINLAAALGGKQSELALDLDAARTAGAKLATVVEDTGDKLGYAADMAQRADQRVSDLEEAFSSLLGTLDDRDAIRNMEKSFDDVEEAARKAEDAGAKAWEAQLAANKARAEGAKDAAELQAAADQAMRDYETATRDSSQAQDDLRREVIKFAEEVDNVPPEKITEILADIDEGSLAEAEAKLHELERDRRINFSVAFSGGATISTSNGSYGLTIGPAHAEGAIVRRPELALIGEAGTEAVLPLNKPSRLRELLADPTVAAPIAAALGTGPAVASGGGNTYNWTVQTFGSERRFVEDLYRMMKRLEAGG